MNRIQNIIKEETETFTQTDTETDVEQLNDNFWKWFGNSKVTNPDGSPMIVYHGTGEDFDVFSKGDFGYHFGTKKAAVSRLRSKKVYGEKRIFKGVYLKIENPLIMKDILKWYASAVVKELEIIGVFKKGEVDTDIKWHELTHQYGYNKTSNWNHEAANNDLKQFVIDKIISKGYDGIKYTNKIENAGSISWVVFKPSQIKSAANNNGEFSEINPDILKEIVKEETENFFPLAPTISLVNEVGEANLQPYPYTDDPNEHAYTDNPNEHGSNYNNIYNFTTEDNDKYIVHINEYNGIATIDFKALDFNDDDIGMGGYGSVLNKGRMYRIMSTLAKIIKEYALKRKPPTVMISALKSKGNASNQRMNIYLQFIKKNIPAEYYIEQTEPHIIIKRKESLAKVDEEQILNKKGIRAILDTDAAYEILDSSKANGSTWCAGGCAILAYALQIAYSYEIYVIYNNTDKQVEHFGVKTPNNTFIDCDGEQREWLKNFRRKDFYLHPEKKLSVLPLRHPENLNLTDIVIDMTASQKLADMIKNNNTTLNEIDDNYKGQHTAPSSNGDDSPMYDVTNQFGEDIYGSINNAIRMFGGYGDYDAYSITLIQRARNKPNMQVKIYRAVPKVITNQDKINDYEKRMKEIHRRGKLPRDVDNWQNASEYYNWLSGEIERLKALPAEDIDKVKINNGDWVTINPMYARVHGQSNLNNKFRVLTKTVAAKNLYTDGNSIHEWGYSI